MADKASEKMLMKDGLNLAAIEHLALIFTRAWPEFSAQKFIDLASNQLDTLELKQRIQQIIKALGQVLPQPFNQTVPVLEAFSQHWQVADSESSLRGFPAWAVTDYVAEFGLNHPELALPLLKKLTPLFSAEFAIRPFIIQHFETTYEYLQQWQHDEDEHVRRLVSEGTRPRLPWGQQLPALIHDPSASLPLLDHLVDDDSEYVRRSVANHLNDIAKDHSHVVIEVCRHWNEVSSVKRDWVIKHATRTLVKQGLPEVFPLLGYDPEPKLKAQVMLEQDNVTLGESLSFSVHLQPEVKGSQKLVLDYAIHHVKANGELSPKVFKLKNLSLTKAQTLQKKHAIKKITTRRYYSGEHKLELLVNGQPVAEQNFYLTVPD